MQSTTLYVLILAVVLYYTSAATQSRPICYSGTMLYMIISLKYIQKEQLQILFDGCYFYF